MQSTRIIHFLFAVQINWFNAFIIAVWKRMSSVIVDFEFKNLGRCVSLPAEHSNFCINGWMGTLVLSSSTSIGRISFFWISTECPVPKMETCSHLNRPWFWYIRLACYKWLAKMRSSWAEIYLRVNYHNKCNWNGKFITFIFEHIM